MPFNQGVTTDAQRLVSLASFSTAWAACWHGVILMPLVVAIPKQER